MQSGRKEQKKQDVQVSKEIATHAKYLGTCFKNYNDQWGLSLNQFGTKILDSKI